MEPKKKGLAGLIIALGTKKGSIEKAKKDTGLHDSAIDDIFDALKSDDKEAFRDAVKSYAEMCKGGYEDDDEAA